MWRAIHPEVLSPEWLPPVPLGRRGDLASLDRWLTEPVDARSRSSAAVVVGPRGSGTSVLARLAARSWVESQPSGLAPGGAVRVRVALPEVHGAQGAAGELLRGLDPEYEPRGFPVADLMAGFLRRLRSAGRPAVVVFDDLGPDAPDLARVCAALLDPDGFLPEGGDGVPAIAVLLAGSPEGLHVIGKEKLGRRLEPRTLRLLPYSEAELAAIVQDRAERSLGRSVPAEWVERVVRKVRRDNGSAVRAIELLRRELVTRYASEVGPVYPVPGVTPSIPIEPPLWHALEQLEEGMPVRIGELRNRARQAARTRGELPIAATTFWRRIIRLERAGVLRRSVRTGGSGGSLSTVVLAQPLRDWATVTDRFRTPPGVAPTNDLSPLWAAPVEWDPEPRSRRGEPSGLPFALSDDGSV